MNRNAFSTVLAVCSLSVSAQAFAADAGSEAGRALVDDAELTLHLRSYYLERQRPAPASDLEAWAGGGWLGYQSGWFRNVFRLGLTGYTSQRISAPSDRDDTLLLKPGQQGYSVLGQAYIALKLQDQVFTAYRQSVDQPEVNPQDNRMTPNTFQGYTLTGKVGSLSYFAGYLDKMKTRNADNFRDFATVAGAPAGIREGMWLGGLSFKPDERLVLRLSSYHVADILTSAYADAQWRMPFAEGTELRLGGQYMYQSSTGGDLLTGSSFDTSAGGLKADMQWGAATISLAYTRTGTGQDYRSPYGTWAGYTSMIVEDFNRAGEQAWLIGAAYDFARHRLPGLSVFVNAVFGDKARDAATRAPLSDKTEYDATLDYRFSGGWPAWLKPLWIRARAVRVEEKAAGVTDVTRDYRLIVNYEWVSR